MRFFLDANVIFAAAYNEGGVCRALFQLAEANLCELVASSFATDEARRNLATKSPASLGALAALLRQMSLVGEPAPAFVATVSAAALPAKDAPILAAAAANRCTVLVTGDRRHFGHLYGRSIAGVRVATPSEALALLLPD